jgi:hypothetical protein
MMAAGCDTFIMILAVEEFYEGIKYLCHTLQGKNMYKNHSVRALR